MPHDALQEFVAAAAEDLGVPGAAVGVAYGGEDAFAFHGVTHLDHPLPVDGDTLFVLGSVTKTVTATAMMRLVGEGRVDLQAPVRLYVPELRLAREASAAEVAVHHLLSHTAGLDWRIDADAGEGDDALAREVAMAHRLTLLGPPGGQVSYSQAGYNLAGRLIEKVTGAPFEAAIDRLIFQPLDLAHSFFFRDDIMTRRFAVGHNLDEGGRLHTARPWRHGRSNNPGGGLASSVADQIRWARFHLGDGRTGRGERLIPAALLRSMTEPHAHLSHSSLGDAVGLGFFLKDIGGVRTFGHDGSANGQFASLLLAPDHRFAVVAVSNAGPDSGLAFNRAARRFALAHYLGVIETDPEPQAHDPSTAAALVGTYENDMMVVSIAQDGPGLTIACAIKAHVRAAATSPPPPDMPAAGLGLLADVTGAFVVTEGGLAGQRGRFTYDDEGGVASLDLAGRSFRRT